MADDQAGQFQQPYLYGEAKAALETPMQGEVYANAPEMESQWKQPWKYDSYPKMEAELAFPGAPGYQLPPGYYGPGDDCTPRGDAIGGGNPVCEPGVDCATWAWNCAHKIRSFRVVSSYGWIQSVQYLPGDIVRVTVCWDDRARAAGQKIGVQALGVNGQNFTSNLLDFGTCCPVPVNCQKSCAKCPTLSIGYASQQMACSGTQALTATGGGGKYTWSMSGGGSLSKTSGPSTVYTAPSTNANCTNNPTITLKDCCGATKTLALAINCYSSGCAYSDCVPMGLNRCTKCHNCNGAISTSPGDCNCNMPGTVCVTTPVCGGCVAGQCCGYEGGSCPASIYDKRSVAQKAGGCCPAALL